MPRRTIVLGRQPTSIDFQDDHGPLVNGLAYAAGQWLASGRDRAQIEMQGEAAAAEDERRRMEHADNMALRQEDLSLRRLALGQQEEDRQAGRDHQAAMLRQTQVRDAANAAESWRDDMGAVAKFGFDNLIGRFLPKAGSGTPSPSADLNRDKFNWDRAVQEIGDPDHDIEVIETTDMMGNPVKREVKRPLSPEERASRVDRINARFRELGGATWKPVPGFGDDAAAPQGAPASSSLTQAALGPVMADGSMVQNTGTPNAGTGPGAPATTSAPAAEPIDQMQARDALTRADQTLIQTMPGAAPVPGMPALTPEQRERLARTVADAKRGVPEAIRALLRWNAKQPDTALRKQQDQFDSEAIDASLIYGLR